MPSPAVTVTTRPWGIAPDGSAAQSFTLSNDTLTLEVLSFGARVVSLLAPDRDGNQADVVLGYAALAPYMDDTAFLGCSVGRYANRIAGGRFTLEGKHYQLDQNDGENTLHGGSDGLWHRNWDGRVLEDGVEFTVSSPEGDQGFPGNLSVTARYRLQGAQVVMEYEATTDQTTVINLTNHAYFNLAGEGSATILDHELQIEADSFTAIDGTAIPLGSNDPVAGTPFDFTSPHLIGERIHEPHPQLVNGKGYDHNFVLRGEGAGLRRAAVAVHPGSGRRLTVETTEPGVQFYSGNYLDGTTQGRSGSPYGFRSAFCLETQHFPDSPNQPEFPSTVLRAGEVFRSKTVWTLEIER
jgi:aldose 1-epimerase